MSEFKVEHYADFGTDEAWVSRAYLQSLDLVKVVPAFAPSLTEFQNAMFDMYESLGTAFRALRELREMDEETPKLNEIDAYRRLYGSLWQAYKDRFQRAVSVLRIDLGFFWGQDSNFKAGAEKLLNDRPELEQLVDLLRRYRADFHNPLAYYRNTYLEHREDEADARMLQSFHNLEAAEETFDDVWQAIEAIVAGLVQGSLSTRFAIVEIPEEERDPGRPDRLRVGLRTV